MHGPAWVRQGKGFALSFDGFDDYVDCGASSSLGIGGPVTIEAWVRPTRKAHGEAVLFGESLSTYMMTYYNTEVCGWYIAGGDNSVLGALTLGEWNHVVAAFDGNRLSIWVNGRLKGSRVSKHKKYKPGGHFMIATKGRPDLPKFKGMIDRVRVYNRALSGKEAMAHFKAEAGGYGFDPSGLNRMKTALYYYPERKEVVLEADYKRLLPFRTKGRLEVALSNKEKPDAIIQRKVVDSLPARSGLVDVPLSSGDLPPGSYLVRAVLKDGTERRSVEEVTFTHPRKPSPVPSPAQKVVAPLAQAQKPTPFKFTMAKGGGFQLRVKGKRYSFRSRISWPRGDFNYLSPTGARYRKGEKGWKVRVRTAGSNKYEVLAGGSFYQVHREVEVFPTHVYIKDRYTNATDKDLGLLIYNEAPLKRGQVIESRLSGYDRRGRQAELSYPDYGPSTFFADANTGMGIVPVDDVFVVQAMPYVEWEGAAGVCTEKFALGPGKSYTLEWAVYPTGSKDYYDFINTFRKVENRISTVEAAPGFIGRRSIPDRVAIDRLNMKIAIVPCISHALDDPKLSLEGIEFVDFPKEMQFLKRTNAAIHKKFPDLKVVLHIAHSLYTTNNPDRFADSKVITATGKQASWGDGSDFGKERKAANWKWWIFYPTPGNSFHDAMMKSVDVLMDELGFDGGFMDGFLAGYCGQWSYDTHLRWDGHSAEIDRATKTIRRKMNSVLLLSQPSMIAFARKIREKGGVVIANNAVLTRTVANEKYITFNCECASGPQQHLAPNVIALARAWGPVLNSEKDVYLDMLDKLSWGELWFSYGEPWERFLDPTALTLAARQFPMTFEEIRSGLVKGPERIVTMNSGVYGWHGDRRLHAVYKFDGRGKPVANDFITTIDKSSVRTELNFSKNESAVIEPIPATLETTAPVNVRVLRYDAGGLHMFLNGRGRILLRLEAGTFPLKPGAVYQVQADGTRDVTTDAGGVLSVPIELEGLVEVTIRPRA